MAHEFKLFVMRKIRNTQQIYIGMKILRRIYIYFGYPINTGKNRYTLYIHVFQDMFLAYRCLEYVKNTSLSHQSSQKTINSSTCCIHQSYKFKRAKRWISQACITRCQDAVKFVYFHISGETGGLYIHTYIIHIFIASESVECYERHIHLSSSRKGVRSDTTLRSTFCGQQ